MSLVDTDLLVDILRKDARATAWFAAQDPSPALSGYVVMELKQGCRNQRELTEVERLVKPLQIVWPTSTACNVANLLFGPLKLSHSVGLIDILIAQTALEAGTALYTFNLKHYSGIPGLDVRRPYIK